MKFLIRHTTRYLYSSSVRLNPQWLRFRPRDDGAQRVVDFRMHVFPEPSGRDEHLDIEGNRGTRVWFDRMTDRLEVQTEMQVETLRYNPFDFILTPGATTLPIAYEAEASITPSYLLREQPDAAVTAFAGEISRSVDHDTVAFLSELSRRMYNSIIHARREMGAPQSPAKTLATRIGACRDHAVLFVDCCRACGIAARFASGYQKGDLASERRDLHAWPEVYLPGAGWRGFDPSHGEAVADSHVTIAASVDPFNTMPVTGSFIGTGASSRLEYKVDIRVDADNL